MPARAKEELRRLFELLRVHKSRDPNFLLFIASRMRWT